MATRKLSPEELQAVSRLAKQWGKIVVKHAFGEQGPGLDVDFAQMEEVACAAASWLDRGGVGSSHGSTGPTLGRETALPAMRQALYGRQ